MPEKPKVGSWNTIDEPGDGQPKDNWVVGTHFVETVRRAKDSGDLRVLPMGNDRYQLTFSPPEADRDQLTVRVVSSDAVWVAGYIMSKDGLEGLKERIKKIVEEVA